MKYANYKCYSYLIDGKKKEYGYNQLKKYFFIDGSEVMYCKKDFGGCEAGKYYLISDGSFYGCGFVVHKQNGFNSWIDKEYMKENEYV